MERRQKQKQGAVFNKCVCVCVCASKGAVIVACGKEKRSSKSGTVTTTHQGKATSSFSSTKENPSNLRCTLCDRSLSSTGVSTAGRDVKSSSKLLVSRGSLSLGAHGAGMRLWWRSVQLREEKKGCSVISLTLRCPNRRFGLRCSIPAIKSRAWVEVEWVGGGGRAEEAEKDGWS